VTIPESSAGLGAIRPAASQAQPPVAVLAREPALWSILSRAERAFFEASSVAGPLSYGPAGAPADAAPALGQHLDIRA
jgi:hypothetical protein